MIKAGAGGLLWDKPHQFLWFYSVVIWSRLFRGRGQKALVVPFHKILKERQGGKGQRSSLWKLLLLNAGCEGKEHVKSARVHGKKTSTAFFIKKNLSHLSTTFFQRLL